MKEPFLEPGPLEDGELELVLIEHFPGEPNQGLVPAYYFEMRVGDQSVGSIDLRVGDTAFVERYAGHIAYGVLPEHRGHRYAARSVQLLFPLAKRHALVPLWVTCNPDNYASRRTCELAGGELVEIVDLPSDCDMYAEGERQKCRYRFWP